MLFSIFYRIFRHEQARELVLPISVASCSSVRSLVAFVGCWGKGKPVEMPSGVLVCRGDWNAPPWPTLPALTSDADKELVVAGPGNYPGAKSIGPQSRS